MKAIRSLLGWGLLLSFALLAPVTLPAGGGSQSRFSIRRSDENGPVLLRDYCLLRSSPCVDSPSLRTLKPGTPIDILRIWHSSDGDTWILVQTNSIDFVEVVGLAKRGWVNV